MRRQMGTVTPAISGNVIMAMAQASAQSHRSAADTANLTANTLNVMAATYAAASKSKRMAPSMAAEIGTLRAPRKDTA